MFPPLKCQLIVCPGLLRGKFPTPESSDEISSFGVSPVSSSLPVTMVDDRPVPSLDGLHAPTPLQGLPFLRWRVYLPHSKVYTFPYACPLARGSLSLDGLPDHKLEDLPFPCPRESTSPLMDDLPAPTRLSFLRWRVYLPHTNGTASTYTKWSTCPLAGRPSCPHTTDGSAFFTLEGLPAPH